MFIVLTTDSLDSTSIAKKKFSKQHGNFFFTEKLPLCYNNESFSWFAIAVPSHPSHISITID